MAEQQQQNLPNGYIPQMKNVLPPLPSSSSTIQQHQFNGIHSSTHSSRDSSPSTRFAQIPSSQLPPSASTTTNQHSVVNNKTPVNNLTQKIEQLNVQSSNFSTSTPILNTQQQTGTTINNFQENYSPISSKVVVPTTQTTSQTTSILTNNKQITASVFDNVPLNNLNKNESDSQLNGHNNKQSNFNGRNHLPQVSLPNSNLNGTTITFYCLSKLFNNLMLPFFLLC